MNFTKCRKNQKNKIKHKTNTTHHAYINFCQADSDDSDGSITSHQQSINSATTGVTSPATKKPAVATRSASTDSTTSTESSASSTNAAAVRSSTTPTATAKQTTKPEVPASVLRTRGSIELVAEKKPFQSRFLPNHQTPSLATEKKEESESSSEEETTSEESEEEEEEEVKKPTTSSAKDSALKTDIGPLLNRSTTARDAYADTRRNSRDETANLRGGYSSPTYGRSMDESKYPTTRRSRANQHTDADDHHSRYGTGSSG